MEVWESQLSWAVGKEVYFGKYVLADGRGQCDKLWREKDYLSLIGKILA